MANKMGLTDLYQDDVAAILRERYKGDKAIQESLAPFEHMDFARQATRDNPLMALPIAAATPLYYLAKNPLLIGAMQRMGLVGQNATPSSIDQMFGAYRGIGQGLFGR